MSNEIRVTIVATGLGDVVSAEPVVIARPQATMQQAQVQQPVAQETIQPQPPVGYMVRCIKTQSTTRTSTGTKFRNMVT